jgi:hypothetical protein
METSKNWRALLSWKHPHMLVWAASIIFLLASLLLINTSLDVPRGETWYVIPGIYFVLATCLWLGISGLLYWLFRSRKLASFLTKLHILTTIGVFTGLIVLLLFMKGSYNLTGTFTGFQFASKFVSWVSVFFVLAQFIFLLNLVLGIFRKKK